MEFDKFELIKEYPDMIAGKSSLRVYRSFDEKRYRYHFGFEENFIRPFCPMVECGPYWGEQHWKEDDGYWIWFTAVLKNDTEFPNKDLERELDFKIKSLNWVLQFFRNAYNNDENK